MDRVNRALTKELDAARAGSAVQTQKLTALYVGAQDRLIFHGITADEVPSFLKEIEESMMELVSLKATTSKS